MINEPKLDESVNSFFNNMRTRLHEKEEEGYTGWDDEEILPAEEMLEELIEDAKDIRVMLRHHSKNEIKKAAVDIANRAMMIWYRQGVNHE